MEAAAEPPQLFPSGFITVRLCWADVRVCVPQIRLFWWSDYSEHTDLFQRCHHPFGCRFCAAINPLWQTQLFSFRFIYWVRRTKFDECHSVDGWRITAGLVFFCFLTSLCLFKAMRSQYFVDWAASHVCSHSCTSAVLEDKQELQDNNSLYIFYDVIATVCVCVLISVGVVSWHVQGKKPLH